MLNIIVYVFSFIIGTLLGSFTTLAVYRIPRKENILNKRSYCPNCNHRLEFWDLIPILSYIFLKGKCRYCKNKVRIRYLILEVFSGVIYTIFIMSLNLDILNITYEKLIYILILTIYIVTLIIIIGIDREKVTINKSIQGFGIIISLLYILYLYIVGVNIYRYVIYYILLVLIFFIKNNDYIKCIIYILLFTLIFTGTTVSFATLILVLLVIAIKLLEKRHKKIKSNIEIPICSYIGICNIILMIFNNFLNNGM